ncbi:hypothetical protein EGW08_016267, partial [Elysia chlorotica]
VNWLKKQTNEDEMMSEARRRGRELRRKHQEQEKMVKQKVREQLLQVEKEKKERELKLAKQKEAITREVHAHGGPCQSADEVREMKQKFGKGKKYTAALKSEIRFIKVVLGRKTQGLKLTGRVKDVEIMLMKYLSPDVSFECESPPQKKQKVKSDSEEDDSSEIESEDENFDRSDDETEIESTKKDLFSFDNQGQWVAVYYDNLFYVGQVIEVKSSTLATVKFLEQSKLRKDYFKWPGVEDVAEVDSSYVFHWDMDVRTVSNDGRVWQVDSVKKIDAAYLKIKA